MILCPLALFAVLSSAAPAAAGQQPLQADATYEFLMARLDAEEGNYDEAVARLDKLIERSPNDPVLLYERAMMLIDDGKVERAEKELRALTSRFPDFYDANRVLGRILLDRASNDPSKIEEALKYLQAAFRTNPDDLSSGLAVTQILTATNRAAEAEKVLATMVERSPDVRAVNYAYAQILTRLGRGDEVRKYLERAVAVDPTFVPAVMQLVEMYQEANEWRKAAEILDPLMTEEGINPELRRQQAYFFLRAGDPEMARERFEALVKEDPQDSRALYYLGEALSDLEEYAKSEQIFRQLLKATPGDADLLASLGLTLSGQKKWDEATKTFKSLVALPDAPENLTVLARTQLAYIDLQQSNYDAAISGASSVAVFRDRPNAQAINIALEATRKQEKPEAAVALLQPLADKFKNDPFVNARLVESLYRAGEKDKAKQLAQAQMKLGTRNTIAAAEAYVQAGAMSEAIEALRPLAASKPDEIDLQFELGSLYERSGDQKAAEKTFLALLDKKPDHAPTLNYLGYMWAESGVHLDRAHEMLTRAVGQEPNNGAYVDSLGWVYFRLGNLELAEKYLTDAVRLSPRDATVAEHLGDVLARRGQMSRALEQYRTALSLDPESKDVDKIRSKIAQLEQQGQTTPR